MEPEPRRPTKFDPTRFQQIAGGLLSLITTFTVLVGIVAVSPILQWQRAKTDLERLEAELEISRISGRAHNVLEPTVQVTPLGGSERDRYYNVAVLLKNNGNRPVRVDKRAFQARLVPIAAIDDDGALQRGAARALDLLGPDDEHAMLRALIVEVAETQTLTTATRIANPGLYLVEVSASPDGAETLQFTGQQFFFVAETNSHQ
jgi:hypothetical protein